MGFADATDEEIREVWTVFDVNSDGVIPYEELDKKLRERPPSVSEFGPTSRRAATTRSQSAADASQSTRMGHSTRVTTRAGSAGGSTGTSAGRLLGPQPQQRGHEEQVRAVQQSDRQQRPAVGRARARARPRARPAAAKAADSRSAIDTAPTSGSVRTAASTLVPARAAPSVSGGASRATSASNLDDLDGVMGQLMEMASGMDPGAVAGANFYPLATRLLMRDACESIGVESSLSSWSWGSRTDHSSSKMSLRPAV